MPGKRQGASWTDPATKQASGERSRSDSPTADLDSAAARPRPEPLTPGSPKSADTWLEPMDRRRIDGLEGVSRVDKERHRGDPRVVERAMVGRDDGAVGTRLDEIGRAHV